MISALLALATFQRPAFHISIIDSRPWLIHGRDRFLLPREEGNWEWAYDQGSLTGWKISGGLTIRRVQRDPKGWQLFDLATFKNGKEKERISFESKGKEWLAKDDLWGGHQRANDLRFSTQRTWISEFMPSPDPKHHWGLAILTLQNLSESAQPIVGEALIRIDFAPLKATFVADIGYFNDPNRIGSPLNHRIASINGRLFVTTKDGISLYDPQKVFGSVKHDNFDKDEYALGQISTGEIIVVNPKARSVHLFTEMKARDVKFSLKDRNIDLFDANVSPDSSLFRIGTTVFSRKNQKGIDYNRLVLLWKDWAIEWDGSTAIVHDGSSGKVIGKADRSFHTAMAYPAFLLYSSFNCETAY